MANPYSSVSVASYNANPPSDDGTQSDANEINWSKHKTKLTDPLKTAIEGIDANLLTAFAKIIGGGGVTTYGTNTTIQASDQGKLVRASAASLTFTTPDAASVSSPFVCGVLNDGGGSLTLDGNGSQTVNGVASIKIPRGVGGILFTDGANWFFVGVKPPENEDVVVAEVVNDSSQTTVYTYTVPANTLGVDRALRLTLIGDYLNNSGANRTLDVFVDFGATTIFSHNITIADSADRRGFEMTIMLAAANATNAQRSSGRYTIGTSNAGGSGTLDPSEVAAIHNAIAEDSTAAKALAVSVRHNLAAVTVSFRLFTAH